MKLFSDLDSPRLQDVIQFKLEDWIDSSPFEHLLGMHIESAEEGRALLSLPFTLKLANGGGVMHGGALTSLADTAVAMAIKSLLPAGTIFATVELAIEFKAPVLEGTVFAHAEVHGSDGRVFRGVCELSGEQDQLFAKVTTVFKVSSKKK